MPSPEVSAIPYGFRPINTTKRGRNVRLSPPAHPDRITPPDNSYNAMSNTVPELRPTQIELAPSARPTKSILKTAYAADLDEDSKRVHFDDNVAIHSIPAHSRSNTIEVVVNSGSNGWIVFLVAFFIIVLVRKTIPAVADAILGWIDEGLVVEEGV